MDTGGTGLWPVVSGVAPETAREERWFHALSSSGDSRLETKFGATPNFTGVTPVRPGCENFAAIDNESQ